MEKIKAFLKGIYTQIAGMHDSPHHVALGFGMGVFLGILPFTGVVAAVTLAVIFKFNRAAALLGSVITNTWLSVVTFFIAGKLGCLLLGYDWDSILNEAQEVISHFSWRSFLGIASLKVLLPLLLGYLIVGAVCGFVSYWVVLIILNRRKR